MSRALTSSAAIKMFSISASRLERRTEHHYVTVEPPSMAASLEMLMDINELPPTSNLPLFFFFLGGVLLRSSKVTCRTKQREWPRSAEAS